MMRHIALFLLMVLAGVIVASPVRSNLGARSTNYTSATDRQLPDDLIAVKYIESTGTQYLDTGIPLYSNMKMEIVFQVSSLINNSVVCGSNLGNQTSRGQYSIGMFFYGGKWHITSNYHNYTGSQGYITGGELLHIIKDENITYFNGLETSRPLVDTYWAGGNCFLFFGGGYHQNAFANKSAVRVFSFTLYNGTKVCDLQPVKLLNESNEWEGAMYDKVGQKLFRNQGTGAFIVGPDL